MLTFRGDDEAPRRIKTKRDLLYAEEFNNYKKSNDCVKKKALRPLMR